MQAPKTPYRFHILMASSEEKDANFAAHCLHYIAIKAGWGVRISGMPLDKQSRVQYVCLHSEQSSEVSFSTTPILGDIDIILGTDTTQLAQLVKQGFSNPEKTTIISPAEHFPTIHKTIPLSNESIHDEKAIKILKKNCLQWFQCDMHAIANKNHAHLGAILLGALAGTKQIPFTENQYIEAIDLHSNIKKYHVKAFLDSYQETNAPTLTVTAKKQGAPTLKHTTSDGESLTLIIKNTFPISCHSTIYQGVKSLIEYQDFQYAEEYLTQLETYLSIDSAEQEHSLIKTIAYYLAKWMCFTDLAHICEIKTRPNRYKHIQKHISAKRSYILKPYEHFSITFRDIGKIFSPKVAQVIMQSRLLQKIDTNWLKYQKLNTHKVYIFCTLNFFAGRKQKRRNSWGYQQEFQYIRRWLQQIKHYADIDYQSALAVAESAKVVYGYGQSRETCHQNMHKILDSLQKSTLSTEEIYSLFKTG